MFESYDKQHDKCMGDRKNRLIFLCVVMSLWAVLALPYTYDAYDSKYAFTVQDLSKLVEEDNKLETALLMKLLGLFLIVFAGFFAIVFACACDKMWPFYVTGTFMTLGGLMLLIYVFIYTSDYVDKISKLPNGTITTVSQVATSIFFAEGILPAVTALVVGFDSCANCMNVESWRLLLNLFNLMIVGSILFVCYYYYATLTLYETALFGKKVTVYALPQDKRDGAMMIATGFLIITAVCAIYAILFICTCCTCNCKDNICIRVLLALGLMAGAILASAGYYTYYNDIFDRGTESAKYAKYACYTFAFTAFLLAYCGAWAIDFAVDDVVKKRKYGY